MYLNQAGQLMFRRAKFLNENERAEVQRRLKADSGHLSNEFDMKYVWQAIKDWKIYIHMLICMAGFCPIYSFALFLPTIIKNMGYTSNNAQLMSVPPYVCACFFTIAASYFADKYRKRGVFLLGFQLIAILGFALLAGSGKAHIQYTGTVFAAIGIYPQIPLGLAWNSGNIGGSLKRGTGIAMQVMGGNCGGIIASYVYISRDGPRFITGHSILIGFVRLVLSSSVGLEANITSMAFFLTLFMSTWCRLENKKREKVAQQTGVQELTDEQKMLERELADNVPWFRYIT
jgi:hypothetical protein